MITDLDAYKEGSSACQNYSGLTMRVRTVAVVVAVSAIAIPLARDLLDDKMQLALMGGSIILAAVAISFSLVDWHYQSAFATIRDSLAILEARNLFKGPWRAHLERRTHSRDHYASYVPFLLLGLIAAVALIYSTWKDKWYGAWLGGTVVAFVAGLIVFAYSAGRACESDKTARKNVDDAEAAAVRAASEEADE